MPVYGETTYEFLKTYTPDSYKHVILSGICEEVFGNRMVVCKVAKKEVELQPDLTFPYKKIIANRMMPL